MNNTGRMQITPKDLVGLIYQIWTTPGRDSRIMAQILIKNYLAQKFGAAVLAHPECESVLEELFKQCVSPLSGPIPPLLMDEEPDDL